MCLIVPSDINYRPAAYPHDKLEWNAHLLAVSETSEPWRPNCKLDRQWDWQEAAMAAGSGLSGVGQGGQYPGSWVVFLNFTVAPCLGNAEPGCLLVLSGRAYMPGNWS